MRRVARLHRARRSPLSRTRQKRVQAEHCDPARQPNDAHAAKNTAAWYVSETAAANAANAAAAPRRSRRDWPERRRAAVATLAAANGTRKSISSGSVCLRSRSTRAKRARRTARRARWGPLRASSRTSPRGAHASPRRTRTSQRRETLGTSASPRTMGTVLFFVKREQRGSRDRHAAQAQGHHRKGVSRVPVRRNAGEAAQRGDGVERARLVRLRLRLRLPSVSASAAPRVVCASRARSSGRRESSSSAQSSPAGRRAARRGRRRGRRKAGHRQPDCESRASPRPSPRGGEALARADRSRSMGECDAWWSRRAERARPRRFCARGRT